jgi:hypothetical protein
MAFATNIGQNIWRQSLWTHHLNVALLLLNALNIHNIAEGVGR